MNEKYKRIIKPVETEFIFATNKFGKFHNAHEGFAVLLEEVDELWDNIKLNQDNLERSKLIRTEAIQVAAVAIRIIYDCCEVPNPENKEIIPSKKKKSKARKNKIKKYDIVWNFAIKGKSVKQIAKIMNISEPSVYEHISYKKQLLDLKELPFTLRRKKSPNPKIKQAWDLALEGNTLSQIANMLKLKEKSAYALLNNHRKELQLEEYPFQLYPKKEREKKKKPLGNIYHQKQDAKINYSNIFDNKGNLKVSTRVISKKISEE